VTVVLTGRDLRRDDVVRVARGDESVCLHLDAIAHMAANRAIVEERLAAGDAVYGLSTAVGVLKRVAVDAGAAAAYSNRMLRQHLIGQGEPLPRDQVRGAMLRLANGFAAGHPGVRPALAERLVRALNAGETPRVRSLGSVGMADLAQNADLAVAIFGDADLEPGEGLALLGHNSVSTGAAALAIADAAGLLDALDAAGALSLEAMAVNPTMLHGSIGDARPYPGLQTTLATLARLLAGSAIHGPGTARHLQDPLTFRDLPQVHGACRDALDHVDAQLAIELNASQGNPIVVPSERRIVSVANFEILPLTAALDYLRILLASALGSSAERSVKQLETPWSGLPTGLSANRDPADPGLAYLGIAVQSIALEARLLAAPVSFELVSTSHAEGIEDRTSAAPLAARRLAEQLALGVRVAAIELTVAAQAADLRQVDPRGDGTGRIAAIVRETVPFLAAGDLVPDVEPLARAVAAGAFAPERLER
jgi:histidine ammonia-lyase